MDESLTFRTGAEWGAWLERHHETHADGVWVKIAKKNAGVESVTIRETLDGALCYGWIDSQRKGLDDRFYLQRYSRRRATSAWSQVNVERVGELIAAGRMRAPGFAEIEAAKADGRWARAYERQATATTPDDLAKALAKNESARRAYEALDKVSRYQLFLPLLKASTPERRADLVERTVTRLAAS
jgi:uncharacterized protein YdeI (YjbR/CyaY-like superfamily)